MSNISKLGIDTLSSLGVTSHQDRNNAVLKIRVPAGTFVLASLSILNPSTVAGDIRMALYDDTGPSTGPGELITETASVPVIYEWNTLPTLATPTLAPGDYWIAVQLSDSAVQLSFNICVPSAERARYYAVSYGAFDATYSVSFTATARQYICYATFNSNPVVIGNTGMLGQSSTGWLGLIVAAKRITLPDARSVLYVSVNITTADGNLRLAIYDATGSSSTPNNLMCQSVSTPMIAGWNHLQVNAELPAADYWLAFQTDSNTALITAANSQAGDSLYHGTGSYGDFPSTFPAPTTSDRFFDMYGTFKAGYEQLLGQAAL